MPDRPWIDTGFILANWEIRPRHGTLLRRDKISDEPARIEPRVMAVLTCLARHGGEVVTRDELSAEVWGGRAVSDEALSRCISLLRHVLGDDSRDPRFIRTIARIGYTLVPIPERLAPSSADDARASSAALAAAVAPQTSIDAGLAVSKHRWSTRMRSRSARLVATGIGSIILIAALATANKLRKGHSNVDAPPPPVTHLLVLPFDSSAAQSVGRDLGVEVADEIADSLAHVGRLQISGRTSADTLAAEHTGALEAGRKLGVDAVLNGEVAEHAGVLQVTTRLTATKDARILWSRVYERQAADIFAAQNGIATAVIRELVGLLDPESLAGVSGAEQTAHDPEAYQLYLRGAHQVRLRGEDSLRRAVDLFSAAARRDPTYARAQIGLAYAYVLLPSYSNEDPTEMDALAEKALASADRLSHSRSEGAGARAYLDFMRGQWIEAETAFRTAIVADPNNPDVRQMYSQLLAAVGRVDSALTQVRLAQEIDPLAPVVADRLGILQLWLGRDAEAASNRALARELGLDETAYPETRILLELHQHDDADAADGLRHLEGALHRSDDWVEPTIDAYRHPEKRPAAIQLLDRTLASGGISTRIYFGLMVLLESPARALRAFAALPGRDMNYLELLFSADAAAVRRDPGFAKFTQKMGLEAYWERFGWPGACHRVNSQIACH
jgi:DNA-binding winged helix-turn-helix (wHTH) protein/TolB-like protein/Tfp pilus assembly protein PilF